MVESAGRMGADFDAGDIVRTMRRLFPSCAVDAEFTEGPRGTAERLSALASEQHSTSFVQREASFFHGRTWTVGRLLAVSPARAEELLRKFGSILRIIEVADTSPEKLDLPDESIDYFRSVMSARAGDRPISVPWWSAQYGWLRPEVETSDLFDRMPRWARLSLGLDPPVRPRSRTSTRTRKSRTRARAKGSKAAWVSATRA